MKKLISILLAVLLIAVLGVTAYADAGVGVEPGGAMPDFTVSLTDGSTATLSELLKEKDLVVLNIFASWCGPCEREFPDMETVYQANSDRMVILSVSGDPNDTMEVISAYKDSHALSFPMGLAGDALDFITVPGFPTRSASLRSVHLQARRNLRERSTPSFPPIMTESLSLPKGPSVFSRTSLDSLVSALCCL